MGVDTTDPTLICKIRTPLESKPLLTLAAVVMDRPDHIVSVEDGWLVVRTVTTPSDPGPTNPRPRGDAA
jgi:hypothetical protein